MVDTTGMQPETKYGPASLRKAGETNLTTSSVRTYTKARVTASPSGEYLKIMVVSVPRTSRTEASTE